MEKRYFLKNSNLLEEIHKSKLTYCCYKEERYGNYDVICESYKMITPNAIKDFFNKHKNRDDIIIRVMTDEHIKEFCTDNRVNLQRIKMSPFKHFLFKKEDCEKVYENYSTNVEKIKELYEKNKEIKAHIKNNNAYIGAHPVEKDKKEPYKQDNIKCVEEIKANMALIAELSDNFSNELMKYGKEVLRSHWKGETIETGCFCADQGKLTDDFVYMIMLLVDQYARSGNWVGYTYLDDMKGAALVHLCDNALKFEESQSSNAFAYLTTIVSNKFKATLNSEKVQSKIKSRQLQDAGYMPTYGEQVNETFKQIYYDANGIPYTKEDDDKKNNDDL